MNTVTRLLQEGDPLRYEAPPSFDAVRERIRQSSPTVSAGPPVPVRRRLVVVSASAVLALSLAWAGSQGPWPTLTPPVSAQVRFEVRLAEDGPAPGLRVAQLGTSGPLIYLHPETVIGNDDVAQGWVVDDGAARFTVGLQLLPSGSERMRQATADHVGRRVAILIDGVVVMAPVVRGPIGDSVMISGQFTREDADRIVIGIGRP